jgi:hypothetical protein
MISIEKTNVIVQALAKADLDWSYKNVVDIGEVPYQANLRALKAIDIEADRDTGKDELSLMLAGIDYLIDELESFRDAAEQIRNTATAVVRST